MKELIIETEHTGPLKTLIEVLKELIPEANIEIRMEKPNIIGDVGANKIKNIKDDKYVSDDEYESDEEEEDEEEESDESDEDAEFDSEYEDDEDEEDDEEDDEDVEDKKKVKKEAKKKCKDGLRIKAVDTTKTVLINLNLYAKNFRVFRCRRKNLVLGVNLGYLHKLIKSMDKDDNISLIVDAENRGYLEIKINNLSSKITTDFQLKLIDLNKNKLVIPDTNFDAVITLNAQKFHKICREMSHIAELVEIKCIRGKIIFTCKGDYANRTTTMCADGNGDGVKIKFSKGNQNKIIQGIYELRNLVLFAKCASLCDKILMFMKNDYPIVIKYTVATLGNIILCLSPTHEEGVDEYTDDEYYSDDE